MLTLIVLIGLFILMCLLHDQFVNELIVAVSIYE